MPVSSALRRLLRIRDMQEDQHRQTLESALGELHSLEDALVACHQHACAGRELVAASVGQPDTTDRAAAQVEIATSERRAIVLAPHIESAFVHASAARQVFLETRVERRQAESLVEAAEAADAVQDLRRDQQTMDDWFGGRRHRETSKSSRKSGPKVVGDSAETDCEDFT